jgi:hypothetical protein
MTATGGKFAGCRGTSTNHQLILACKQGCPERDQARFWTPAVIPLAREVATSIFHFFSEAGTL